MILRALVLTLLVPAIAWGNPESAALRARGFAHAYSLHYDLATRDMEAAVKADPRDAAAP